MSIKWIVFNGPPQSGKSSAALWLRQAIRGIKERQHLPAPNIVVDSFAAPMKHFLAVALGEKYQDMNKTKMRPELTGYSVREFNIHLAERYMKERYGEDIFARWLVYRNMRNFPQPDHVIIDDGGFDIERIALTKPRIVRMERKGCSFNNDSRHYWQNPTKVIQNDGTHEELYAQVTDFARYVIETDMAV